MEDHNGSQSKTRVRKNNAESIKPPLSVVSADFIGGYRLYVHFSDGTQRIIDFGHAFSQLKGYYARYGQPDLFQTFIIDNGNLVWGEDWDIIYPTWDLHEGKIG